MSSTATQTGTCNGPEDDTYYECTPMSDEEDEGCDLVNKADLIEMTKYLTKYLTHKPGASTIRTSTRLFMRSVQYKNFYSK